MTNSEALEMKPSRRALRRIGAVLAGLLVVAILDTTIDLVMHRQEFIHRGSRQCECPYGCWQLGIAR